MATQLSSITGLIPTEVPSLGVSLATAYLMQATLVLKHNGEASGERRIVLYTQNGGIDDNSVETWDFTPATGWVLTDDLSDISPALLKDAVEEAPSYGRWFSLGSTEMADTKSALIGA